MSYMNADKIFIDTNILIYAYTSNEMQKCEVVVTFIDDHKCEHTIYAPKYTGVITEDYFANIKIDTNGFVFNRDEANER